MFRDRTNLYISYRRTFPHRLKPAVETSTRSRLDELAEEEEGLMANGANNRQSIEMTELPPSFFDIGSEIDEHLKYIDGKVNSLNGLYKKNLLPGFNDRTHDEEEIEKLNYLITKKFQTCYNLVTRLEYLRNHGKFKNNDEVMMLENMKKNYALKIQTASSGFRNIQNNYIRFLKDDEYEELPSANTSNVNSTYNPALEETANIESYSQQALTTSKQLQMSTSDQFIKNREQEISKLAQGVLEVSSIFREMEHMVIEQGTILDRIDYNLENVKIDVIDADKQLNKATVHQKRTQKCKIIFLLGLIVLALIIIVIVKPRNHSSGSNDNHNIDDKDKGNGNGGDNISNGDDSSTDPENSADNVYEANEDQFLTGSFYLD